MRRVLWAFPTIIVQAAIAAEPTTDTNVVASAADAFGTSIGPESIGLYSAGSIRGFSPISAGNVRIDGLYFDLQGAIIDRLATDSRIRVGLSATSFPWPAPSGIVDYTLREAKANPDTTSIIYTGPYDSLDVDLDGSTKLLGGQFGIAAGGSYHRDEAGPAQSAHTISWGLLPKWYPSSSISISTFWGRQATTDAKPQATIYPAPGQTLPPVSPRYMGPSWLNSDSESQNYGMLVKAELSTHWSARFGLFHSTLNLPINYFDLYLNTTSYGFGDHVLVEEHDQHYDSNSGDFQLIYRLDRGALKQEILLGARGRSERARYGGAGSFNFGSVQIETPEFTGTTGSPFGPSTTNRIREHSSGFSYKLGWSDRISFAAGLRRDAYSNEVVDPDVGSSSTSLQPWLYNTSVAFRPTKSLTLFGALTRGLENSGVAPVDAVNRGQVLPATRSSQGEIGGKYAPSSSLSLLAGAFSIEKSYFALDDRGQYDNLGQERHRGIEFSLAGEPISALRIVAGAVLMSPEVLPRSAPGEVIGRLPIGVPRRFAQLGLNYNPSALHAFSFDAILSYSGSRVASVDNQVQVPGYATLDLGIRYEFTLEQHSATLRLQIPDIANTFNWSIANDGGLMRLDGRRAWAYLIVDL